MKLHEGMKICCGVFTTDREYAEGIINCLKDRHGGKVEKYINTTNELSCYMDDGTNYIWLKPNLQSKGFRCSQAIIDISTCSLDAIQRIILPICLVYGEREDLEVANSIPTGKTMLFKLANDLTKIAYIKGDIPVYYNDYDSPPNDMLGYEISKDGLNLCG